MEIIIYKPNKFVEAIEFNYEELKKELSIRLEKYQNLVFSDSEIKLAKTDRATLNKLKEAIENKRKEIKKQCLKPYEEFESKIKELVNMIDQPIESIDSQVIKYEEEQKKAKYIALGLWYAELSGTMGDVVPFEKILNQKWLNASVNIINAKAEITAIVTNLQNSFNVLRDLQTPYSQQVLDKFIQTLDLPTALAENKRLTEQAERIKKMEEESKKAEEEKKKTQEVVNTETVLESPVEVEKPTEEPKLQQIDFRVWVTEEQKNMLKTFFIAKGIKYGSVK